jgi:thiamine-monophosphate kinase
LILPHEVQLIDRIRARVPRARGAGLALGIGDDCAVFRPRGSSEDLLFTTDLLVEDIHFRRETHSAADIGWKALARGLSDIAAMGGEPRFCMLSLALAPWNDTRWLDAFYRGFLKLAARERVPLAGGDLGRSAKTTCDIVVCGAAPRGKWLRRDGARPGQAIYVSGELGGSALGLTRSQGAARRKHLRPEPRLALGRYLRTHLHATAGMDLSDGLSLDLHRLSKASGLSAEIEPPPIFPGATLDQALHGGEDYELLFTVPPRARVPAAFESLRLTRIGTMRKGRPGEVRMRGQSLPPEGYDHFKTHAPSRPRARTRSD